MQLIKSHILNHQEVYYIKLYMHGYSEEMMGQFLEKPVSTIKKSAITIQQKFNTNSWHTIIASAIATGLIIPNDYCHKIVKKEALAVINSKFAYYKFKTYTELTPYQAIKSELTSFHKLIQNGFASQYKRRPKKLQLNPIELETLALYYQKKSSHKTEKALQINSAELQQIKTQIFTKLETYNWLTALQKGLQYDLINHPYGSRHTIRQLKTSSINIIRILNSKNSSISQKTQIYNELLDFSSALQFKLLFF